MRNVQTAGLLKTPQALGQDAPKMTEYMGAYLIKIGIPQQARPSTQGKGQHNYTLCNNGSMDKQTFMRVVQIMKKVRIAYREDALAFKHGWIYEVHWNLRWMFRDHHVVTVID